MSGKNQTGPDLYLSGLELFDRSINSPEDHDHDNRVLLALQAAAAFAGAQAAAFGALASDESESDTLGKDWRNAIGDGPDTFGRSQVVDGTEYHVGDSVVGHSDSDHVHGVVEHIDGEGGLGINGTPLEDFEGLTLVQRADS